MKKLLVALLCAIMLLTCAGAMAEENGSKTFGEFTCWVDEADGVFIEKYNLAEGQETLFIPKVIEGHRVQGFSVATLPESVKTVYLPNDCGWDGDGITNRELTMIHYADYDWVMGEEWYSKHLTDMGEDDYALTWANVMTWKNGDAHEKEASAIYAEDLPAEMGGHKVHSKLLNDGRVIFTSGEWQYMLNTYDERFKAEIMGYLGESTEQLAVPYEIDGYAVNYLKMECVPASVKTLFKGTDTFIQEDESKRAVVIVSYGSYEDVQSSDGRREKLPDMTEDEWALLQANIWTFANGSSGSKDTRVYADEMPAEFFGKKVRMEGLGGSVIYTCGDWQYTRTGSNNKIEAEIVGSTLADDVKEIVVPLELEGYKVKRLDVAAVPSSVELMYVGHNIWYTNDKSDRTIKVISYADYETVQQDSWYSERVPEMTENDLALMNAQSYTFGSDGYNSKSIYVYADELPTELAGKKCLCAMNVGDVWRTSGRWIYAYSNNEKDSVAIKDVTGVEGQTTLFVPSTIEGVLVSQIDNTIADKYGITMFVAPRNGWFYGEGKASFGALYYYDRAWVDARQDDYYTERYAWLGENDLSVEDYTHYANGETTKETIEYKDIPAEVEGKKLVNKMYFDDNVTVHKKDDYSYVILADDTIALVKYENKLAKSLIIPARIDGKTVTAMMSSDYNYVVDNSELTSLELPSTLKVLGNRAISAWNLKKLEIPEGVTEIGENAIQSYKLNSLNLPEGLTKLGTKWLYSWSLKSVSFPATLTTLADNAFSAAHRLDSVKLPETVTNVGKAAFSEMERLSKLTLPENMVEIPERLAAASERLAKITIPAATETIGKQAFAGCTKLATVSFAKKDAQTKVIGDGAFAGSGLSKIALPESLTTIGKEAFQGCEKLSSVSMYDNITSIEPYAFSGCTKLTKISLSESLTTIKEGTFMGCKKLASVTIPESVTAIEDFAFEGCASKLTLTVTEGSFAHQWAEANGYKVKLAK